MSKKVKDLIVIFGVYVLAYAIGILPCFYIENTMLRYFVFDVVATVVTYIFSTIFRNSSVYDAYWSLTPMVMSVHLFVVSNAFSIWQLLFLFVFNLWSLRLTINWITVTTGFSYEDWRYRKFRDENPPILWHLINFSGIHFVPTLVVFWGMLPLFEIAKTKMNAMCLFGIAIMLFGILLEHFADKQMHKFLQATTKKAVCRKGLWNYSRHPNYLGEISVWVGVFVTMLPFRLDKWYYAVGALSIALLFNIVSIPMMEKRQLKRRPDYKDYQNQTSRLLLLYNKNRQK